MESTLQPLIITLELDESSQMYFDRLRRMHFPAERNFLSAHFTLFHNLPGHELETICKDLQNFARQTDPIPLYVSEVKSIGRGVAFSLESEEVKLLHAHMQQKWHNWLVPQDRQKLWPHVTIQNKVKPEEAARLKEALQKNFQPFTATGLGLQLYTYQDGPWAFEKRFPF